MRKSAWRLALSIALFAAWIGYLAYLAKTTTEPIVLSRPQFLSAELYVVATIPADAANGDQPSKSVTVKQVYWAASASDKASKTLQIADVPSLKDLLKTHAEQKSKKEITETDKKFVWDGAGDYILALSRPTPESDVFVVTRLPPTPGFRGAAGRVYPATAATQRQLESLAKEFHP